MWVKFVDALGLEAWHDMDQPLPSVYEIVANDGVSPVTFSDPLTAPDITYCCVCFYRMDFRDSMRAVSGMSGAVCSRYYEDRSMASLECRSDSKAWERRGEGFKFFERAWRVFKDAAFAELKWRERYVNAWATRGKL